MRAFFFLRFTRDLFSSRFQVLPCRTLRIIDPEPEREATPMGQPVVHFEIGCRDSGKTAAFFSKLFGWDMQAMGPATMVNTGSTNGIQGHISALGHEPHHYTT